jgi:hypothetical protein
MDSVGGEGAPITLAYEADLCGNIEQALKALQGYGLMALELIQNADDAKATTLAFDVGADALVVRNDAQFSTCGLENKRCPWEQHGDDRGIRRPCNFHAISKMGSRSKVFAPDQIGRFGIGFVSVYQATDTPIVRSRGTQLKLNPLTGEAGVQKFQTREGTEFELRWASTETEVRQALNASPTPANVQDVFLSEVEEVLRNGLLFLRHLERVELLRNGVVYFRAEISRTENRVAIRFEPDGSTEQWLTLVRDARDIIEEGKLFESYPALEKLDRSAQTTVAVRLNATPVEGLLYAYLPTQQSTDMPLNINADFFPHASRQHIVLQGEGHERYWNEALLASAAATLAENFELLKEVLGAKHLWELLDSAFKLRAGPFSEFWSRLNQAVRETDSVLTTSGEWAPPSTVKLPPEQMTEGQQAALAQIGIKILNKSLRPHWTVLSTLGGSELRLINVASALEALGEDGPSARDQDLDSLWSAVELMIEGSLKRSDHQTIVGRLSKATFVWDVNKHLVSPTAVWRLALGARKDLVHRFIPDCPLVHDRVLAFPLLAGVIDEYRIEELSSELADEITDVGSAETFIGTADESVRAFYALLTSFPPASPFSDIASTLANAPILRTPDGFVAPSRGQLPGGFQDPVGHFTLIDTSLFTPAMDSFAREILHVSVLTFDEYISDHLTDILQDCPTKEQYRALLGEITTHRNQLEEAGALDVLTESPFVRTRSGAFNKPLACYFKTAELEALLGDDDELWVDESWMPGAPLGSKFRDILETRLGMPRTVSVSHIVDRVQSLSDRGRPEIVARAVAPIIRYIIDHWARFSDEDREQLAELHDCEFLPAIIGSEPDEENLYSPEAVYRAVRAAGFASQVPVVNLPALRQASAVVNELLDLWEMPTEPSTDQVVAHLEHCMRTGEAVSDLTYAILNERVEDDEDAEEVDRLHGEPFIYDSQSERFLRADQVFWQPPPFGNRWSAANNSMRRREALYTRLGVKAAPGPSDFAGLALELAQQLAVIEDDLEMHRACVARLAEAFDRNEAGSTQALELLLTEESLFNVDAEAVLPGDALWIDFEHLVEPFGAELNARLVEAPSVEYGVAARFFRRLGTKAVSDVVQLKLSDEPDGLGAPEATARLQERASLLLWLAPNTRSRLELRRMLEGLELRLTKSLRVRAEIDEFDEVIRSDVTDAPAFYDREKSILHIRGSKVSINEWAAAFRTLFAELEQYCPSADVKPLTMSASALMAPDTAEDAEEYLTQSGFQAPQESVHIIAPGEALADSPEIESLDDVDDAADLVESESTPPNHVDGTILNAGDPDGRIAPDGVINVRGADRAHPDENSDEVDGTYDGKVDSQDFDEDAYGSKRSTGAFGASSNERGPTSSERATSSRQHKRGETLTDRHARKSRMLAYVVQGGTRGADDSEAGRASEDISELIDVAAMKAVLKYEQNAGREAIEQPHHNPGFDVRSTASDGTRRLIEVKGLESDWTERGIKLSHVQYAMAREHPDEFWIYVVENARDPHHQVVSAIRNPFQKVEEYWFDHNWRDIREESASSKDLNAQVGALVTHHTFGKGEILEVIKRGLGTQVKVRFFDDDRLKLIPFNSQLDVVE